MQAAVGITQTLHEQATSPHLLHLPAIQTPAIHPSSPSAPCTCHHTPHAHTLRPSHVFKPHLMHLPCRLLHSCDARVTCRHLRHQPLYEGSLHPGMQLCQHASMSMHAWPHGCAWACMGAWAWRSRGGEQEGVHGGSVELIGENWSWD